MLLAAEDIPLTEVVAALEARHQALIPSGPAASMCSCCSAAEDIPLTEVAAALGARHQKP